jgi:hypothetical protein
MYGNCSLPRSCGVSGCRISRAFGPQIPKQAHCEVTSRTTTEPSPGRWRRIHSRSWFPNAVPVTIENSSSPRRPTVKSHSIPPREFSICV